MVPSSPAGRVAPCAGDVVGAEGGVVVAIEGRVVEAPGFPSVLPNEVEVEPSAEALEVEDVASVSELLAEHPAAIEARISTEQIEALARLP
jgi:hypothetical protein